MTQTTPTSAYLKFCMLTRRSLLSEKMERLLSAAKELSDKVESNETAAGDLLRQCESLQQELKAMKQVKLCHG